MIIHPADPKFALRKDHLEDRRPVKEILERRWRRRVGIRRRQANLSARRHNVPIEIDGVDGDREGDARRLRGNAHRGFAGGRARHRGFSGDEELQFRPALLAETVKVEDTTVAELGTGGGRAVQVAEKDVEAVAVRSVKA